MHMLDSIQVLFAGLLKLRAAEKETRDLNLVFFRRFQTLIFNHSATPVKHFLCQENQIYRTIQLPNYHYD